MRLNLLSWLFLAGALNALTSIAIATDRDAPVARIPFVEGLTTVRATSEPRGDYENLRIIEKITPDGYRLTASGEVPADDGSGLLEISIVRRVRAEDQRSSRRMRTYFHTGDAEQFTGTVPGLSAAVLADLRKTGHAQVSWLDIGVMFGMSRVKRELSGTIARVDGGTTTLPMLVNGQRVLLPVIHVKGRLSDSTSAEEVEFHALDDPDNPILLRSRLPGFSSAVIRVEYPQPKRQQLASPTSIESSLARNEVAKVYGIYFSFNRAVLRPESERVLKEIGEVMKAHPEWKLRVDGHTDGIGNDEANLELSRRRAQAVKAVLVTRYAIDSGRLTTGGYGESSPQDTNETQEGRAHNRRVELRRE